MDEYDAERDGELLPARNVVALLGVGRGALHLLRDSGELRYYRMLNGHYRYPSRQPALLAAAAPPAPLPAGVSELSTQQVCDLLFVTRSTLADWRTRGDLTGRQDRQRRWWYRSDQPVLADALAALRQDVTP